MKLTLDFELNDEQFQMLRIMQYEGFSLNEQTKECVELQDMGLCRWDYTFRRWELLEVGKRLVLE